MPVSRVRSGAPALEARKGALDSRRAKRQDRAAIRLAMVLTVVPARCETAVVGGAAVLLYVACEAKDADATHHIVANFDEEAARL